MNSQLLSWAKFLIGWPLSILSIFFIVKFLADKGGKLNISLSDINFLFFGLGILSFFVYFILRCFLWKVSLGEKGESISFRENTYRFSISEIKRYVPGSIWGFLSRASLFSDAGVDRKTLGIAILADIQLVILGCGIVSIAAIPWILGASADLQIRLSALLPISLAVALVFFLVTGWVYRKKYAEKGESILSCFILPGYSMSAKTKLILLSIPTYFIFGAGNYFIMDSVKFIGFESFFAISSFFVFSLLVGYLSFITPMGLGVREAVVTLGLSKIMSATDAGFIAIFTRTILIASELAFLMIVFIWEKLNSKK